MSFKRDLLDVACKVLGIFILFTAFKRFIIFVYQIIADLPTEEGYLIRILESAIYVVICLIFAYLFTRRSSIIVNWIYKDDSNALGIEKEIWVDLLFVNALRILGLILVVNGISSVFELMRFFNRLEGLEGFLILASYLLPIAFGSFLLIKYRAFSAFSSIIATPVKKFMVDKEEIPERNNEHKFSEEMIAKFKTEIFVIAAKVLGLYLIVDGLIILITWIPAFASGPESNYLLYSRIDFSWFSLINQFVKIAFGMFLTGWWIIFVIPFIKYQKWLMKHETVENKLEDKEVEKGKTDEKDGDNKNDEKPDDDEKSE